MYLERGKNEKSREKTVTIKEHDTHSTAAGGSTTSVIYTHAQIDCQIVSEKNLVSKQIPESSRHHHEKRNEFRTW